MRRDLRYALRNMAGYPSVFAVVVFCALLPFRNQTGW